MATLIGAAKAMLEETKDELAKALSFVPEDKRAWRPVETATSALDIVVECAFTLNMGAKLLRGEVVTMDGPTPTGADYSTADAACAYLEATHSEIQAAIDGIDESRLDEVVRLPWGSQMPLSRVLMLFAGHNAYHAGQLSYIQRLLGDTGYHFE